MISALVSNNINTMHSAIRCNGQHNESTEKSVFLVNMTFGTTTINLILRLVSMWCSWKNWHENKDNNSAMSQKLHLTALCSTMMPGAMVAAMCTIYVAAQIIVVLKSKPYTARLCWRDRMLVCDFDSCHKSTKLKGTSSNVFELA